MDFYIEIARLNEVEFIQFNRCVFISIRLFKFTKLKKNDLINMGSISEMKWRKGVSVGSTKNSLSSVSSIDRVSGFALKNVYSKLMF